MVTSAVLDYRLIKREAYIEDRELSSKIIRLDKWMNNGAGYLDNRVMYPIVVKLSCGFAILHRVFYLTHTDTDSNIDSNC